VKVAHTVTLDGIPLRMRVEGQRVTLTPDIATTVRMETVALAPPPSRWERMRRRVAGEPRVPEQPRPITLLPGDSLQLTIDAGEV
jgi:hypothetical protein